jgi:hypothetical protein
MVTITTPGIPQAPISEVRILVQSSVADRGVFTDLRKHFATDKRIELVSLDDTLPGHEWAKERDAAIEKASCIIFLLSSDFFGSDTTYEEAAMMLQRRQDLVQADLCLVLVVRPVDWRESPFGDLPDLLPEEIPRNEERLLQAVIAIKHQLQKNNLL